MLAFLKDPIIAANKKFLISRKWFFFSWEMLIILITALLASILNQLPEWFGEKTSIAFVDGDEYYKSPTEAWRIEHIDHYIANSWTDNMYYSFISLGVTIFAAIYCGVHNVMGKFLGSASSALFALVPSVVWILTTSSHGHIDQIVNINNIIYKYGFYTIGGMIGLFLITVTLKRFLIGNIFGFETRRLLEIITNVLYRINAVFVNIAILFILSAKITSFGIFNLHLADVDMNAQMIAAKDTGNFIAQYDLGSQEIIFYLTIVTIMFAVLITLVGLATTISRKKSHDIDVALEGKMKEVVIKETKAKEAIQIKDIEKEAKIVKEQISKETKELSGDIKKIEKEVAKEAKENIKKASEIVKLAEKAKDESVQVKKKTKEVEKIKRGIEKEKDKIEKSQKKIEKEKEENN